MSNIQEPNYGSCAIINKHWLDFVKSNLIFMTDDETSKRAVKLFEIMENLSNRQIKKPKNKQMEELTNIIKVSHFEWNNIVLAIQEVMEDFKRETFVQFPLSEKLYRDLNSIHITMKDRDYKTYFNFIYNALRNTLNEHHNCNNQVRNINFN